SHTCAVKAAGSLACWGYDLYGQASPPASLGTVTQVSAGGAHTCAVKVDGTVACWGWNAYGQATPPAGLGSALQVEAGQTYSCAIMTDHSLACWGSLAVAESHPDPTYTPPGGNVQVTPRDQTTGQPSPVGVTFSEVTGSGTTTVQ